MPHDRPNTVTPKGTDTGMKAVVRDRLIAENEFPPIPAGWSVERLRFLLRESKERNGKEPVGDMLSVSEYRGVVPKEYEHEEQRRSEEELENYRVVRPGQLAVNSMWLNHLGLGVSDHLGHVSPAYGVYDISPRLDRRYVHHLVRSNFYLKLYLRYLYGIRPNSFQIKANDWGSLPIIVPDLPAQHQIADFLDRETARVDLLIEKKQRLVDLLDERRKLTLGEHLGNQPSSMREDIRPWLSSYAGTWPVKRLSHFLAKSPCYGVLKPDDFAGEGAVPIIRIRDIAGSQLNREEIVTISPAQSEEYRRTIINEGDVILSVVGTIGKTYIVRPEDSGMNLTRALARIQLTAQMQAPYFCMVINSSWFTDYVSLVCQGSAQKVLNMEALSAFRFPVPDVREQSNIVAAYSEAVEPLMRTSDTTVASIDRLREYRSALITAAVTGQIDPATWSRNGEGDRRLDAIEAEMSA